MSTKQKQQFLYANIIEPNYDPEEFQQFLELQRGLNLEDYSLEDLMQCVHLFKRTAKPLVDAKEVENMRNSGIEFVSSESPRRYSSCVFLPERSSHSQGASSVAEEPPEPQPSNGVAETEEVVPYDLESEALEGGARGSPLDVNPQGTFANPRETLALTNLLGDQSSRGTPSGLRVSKKYPGRLYQEVYGRKRHVEVEVRSYSKIEASSIFDATYIVYCVCVDGKTVRRRFNEFQELHAYLAHAYPALPIPPIPQKTLMRSFSEKHLERRMMMFEQFLRKLLRIPELCSDQCVEDFLTKQSFLLQAHSSETVLTLKGTLPSESAAKVTQADTERLVRRGRMLKGLNDRLAAVEEAFHELLSSIQAVEDSFRELRTSEASKLVGGDLYELLGGYYGSLK